VIVRDPDLQSMDTSVTIVTLRLHAEQVVSGRLEQYAIQRDLAVVGNRRQQGTAGWVREVGQQRAPSLFGGRCRNPIDRAVNRLSQLGPVGGLQDVANLHLIHGLELRNLQRHDLPIAR
jgi:hypothetical protein